MRSNEELVRAFIQAVADRVEVAELERFFHPAIEQEEFPNRLVPRGARRDRQALLDGARRGRQVLSGERYEVRRLIASGHDVVAEIDWEGTTALALGALPAGSTLRARICQVFELEDGRIRRLRNYDCYEPF